MLRVSINEARFSGRWPRTGPRSVIPTTAVRTLGEEPKNAAKNGNGQQEQRYLCRRRAPSSSRRKLKALAYRPGETVVQRSGSGDILKVEAFVAHMVQQLADIGRID